MADPHSDAQQAAAALRVEFAPRLGQYFNALCEQGFQRIEALELVRDLQGEMLMRANDE